MYAKCDSRLGRIRNQYHSINRCYPDLGRAYRSCNDSSLPYLFHCVSVIWCFGKLTLRLGEQQRDGARTEIYLPTRCDRIDPLAQWSHGRSMTSSCSLGRILARSKIGFYFV